jgi:hypothetical protein
MDHMNEERRIYRKERQGYAKTAKVSELFASFAKAKPLCVLCGKFLVVFVSVREVRMVCG